MPSTASLIMTSGFSIALILGLALLVAPSATLKTLQQLLMLASRLCSPLYLERWFYRYHRWFGGFIGLGSLYVLLSLQQQADFIDRLGLHLGSDLWAYQFLQALLIFIRVAVFLTFILGVVIFYRPSRLKDFERWANQVITRQLILQWWQRISYYPRWLGLTLILLATLGWWWLFHTTALIDLVSHQ